MSELAIRPWTVAEFFIWQERQDKRYELVGGFPLEMMTGASNRHDDIVVNILVNLGEKLRGKPCRPFTADGSVETLPGQIRRPDIGVDCGERDPAGYRAAQPVVLIEVMSPSTRNFDRYRKIGEYQTLATVRHIVFVEPGRPMVRLVARDGLARTGHRRPCRIGSVGSDWASCWRWQQSTMASPSDLGRMFHVNPQSRRRTASSD